MSDFFDSLKSLFSAGSKSNAPLVHEMLERTPAQQEAMQVWTGSKRKERIVAALRQVAEAQTGEPAGPLPLTWVESAKSNGFVLYFEPELMAEKEFQHLFDWLQQQVLAHGYSSYMSDIKQQIKGDLVETKERHYLKPSLNLPDGAKVANQLFGNITIEHTLIDNRPQHIKFIANIYSDQNYTTARHYRELIGLIVE